MESFSFTPQNLFTIPPHWSPKCRDILTTFLLGPLLPLWCLLLLLIVWVIALTCKQVSTIQHQAPFSIFSNSTLKWKSDHEILWHKILRFTLISLKSEKSEFVQMLIQLHHMEFPFFPWTFLLLLCQFFIQFQMLSTLKLLTMAIDLVVLFLLCVFCPIPSSL